MTNLLCFYDFSLQYFLNQTQLQNVDILQLVSDSVAVFMSTQVPGVISEKNTYGHIPHHSLIIYFSPQSLNGILQAVVYVGTQTRRETPNRTRTIQMSLILLRDHHQSPSLVFIWKDNYPQVISRQLCKFVTNMARETEGQGQILWLIARFQKSENTLF